MKIRALNAIKVNDERHAARSVFECPDVEADFLIRAKAAEPVGVAPVVSSPTEDEFTKEEIMKALERAEVVFNPRDKKSDLYAQLAEAMGWE